MGIAAFVILLGLIYAIDRIWAALTCSGWSSPRSCSRTSCTRSSAESGS